MSSKILLSKDIENQICNLIKNHTQKEIGLIYGLSQSFISAILKKNNINAEGRFRLNRNKLNVDIDFFKEIDDPKKAYWLGYLCADGNINNLNTKCSLVSKDIEIIEKFKKDINSEHKLSKNIVVDKRNNRTYVNFTIQITNKNFVLNLNKWGLTSNKSEILSVPKIDDALLPYFFAGLFDGDGYIGFHNNKVRMSLISTKEILVFLQNYLITKHGINLTKLQLVTKNKNNVWKLLLYKDSLLFFNWIYKDKKFNYLNRKYDKYRKHISHIL